MSMPTTRSSACSTTRRRGQSAWDVAGAAYKSRTTLYEFPDGRRLRGNEIRDWRALSPGTKVTLGVP